MTNDTSRQAQGEQRSIRSLAQDVGDLVKRLEGSTVRRIAIEADGCKIEIERSLPVTGDMPTGLVAASVQTTASAASAVEADNRHPIVAPLVGTFYRSPQPGAKTFVEEGDVVDKGQTIGIVEAMKIMNQIQADRAGRVASILLQDGDWVEFQQVLMYLEPLDE